MAAGVMCPGEKKEDTGNYARCLPEGRKCAVGAGISGLRDFSA